MKHPRTHLACHGRIVSRSHSRREQEQHGQDNKFSKAGHPPGELIDHCYRALLETSSSAILLLSPESIILGWNRAAEAVFGWIADEALGRSYVELCFPMKARESFLTKLAQVTSGRGVRGFESPLRTRTGSHLSPGPISFLTRPRRITR